MLQCTMPRHTRMRNMLYYAVLCADIVLCCGVLLFYTVCGCEHQQLPKLCPSPCSKIFKKGPGSNPATGKTFLSPNI